MCVELPNDARPVRGLHVGEPAVCAASRKNQHSLAVLSSALLDRRNTRSACPWAHAAEITARSWRLRLGRTLPRSHLPVSFAGHEVYHLSAPGTCM